MDSTVENIKVLVSNTYFYRYDAKQWSMGQPYPPLGTLYAISQLRDKKYDVSFFDTNLVHHQNEIFPFLEARPKYYVIYDDGFNYLTKMCLSKMKDAAFEMMAEAKNVGATVIINSSDSTDQDKEYLQAGADYVIHGEGEETLLRLLDSLEMNITPTEVLGLSFYDDDEKYVKTPGRPVKKNLDELKQAAWDLVDIQPYKDIWMKNHGYFAINIATTRGCPYKCNWCAKPIYGNRYNSRSPENVIEEIEGLINRFDVNYFWMCDDIFGLKPNWVQRFRDLKKEKGLEFQYKIQSRVDLMLAEDNLQALADSGAHEIWIGAESGSQKILDAMDKGIKVEQIAQATKLLKERNVRVAFFLQFGYLDETIKDIKKTIQMVMDLMPDEIGISVSYPLPGTKFYDKVKMQLGQKKNWTDSDDLDLMFQNTYSPKFYKELQRYVHDKYHMKKGWLSAKRLLGFSFKDAKQDIYWFARMFFHIPLVLGRGLRLKMLSSKTNANGSF